MSAAHNSYPSQDLLEQPLPPQSMQQYPPHEWLQTGKPQEVQDYLTAGHKQAEQPYDPFPGLYSKSPANHFSAYGGGQKEFPVAETYSPQQQTKLQKLGNKILSIVDKIAAKGDAFDPSKYTHFIESTATDSVPGNFKKADWSQVAHQPTGETPSNNPFLMSATEYQQYMAGKAASHPYASINNAAAPQQIITQVPFGAAQPAKLHSAPPIIDKIPDWSDWSKGKATPGAASNQTNTYKSPNPYDHDTEIDIDLTPSPYTLKSYGPNDPIPGERNFTPWYLKNQEAASVQPVVAPIERKPILNGDPTVERLEQEHFVKDAPRFADILDDPTRTNRFQYAATEKALWNSSPDSKDKIVEMTEHVGLNRLHDFLTDYVSKMENKTYNPKLIDKARGILENLTFIGDKEYQEAAAGLGTLWKAYLDADPGNQLCVPTKISQQGGKRKSDIFLFENIMTSFTDDELAKYGGRIVTDLDQITQDPGHTRIVLLDDWTISGAQMRSAYSGIKADSRFKEYADSVEVNLLVSSANRLEEGLKVGDWNNVKSIPVKSYYKAHDAGKTSDKEHSAHVTGTHSSVDFDFEQTIGDMVRDMADSSTIFNNISAKQKMPPLTNIVRTYRYAAPKITVYSDGKIMRNKV